MIRRGEVHVWCFELDRVEPANVLDDTERARAAAFRFEDGRRRFTAAHVALRRTLARYADCDPAAFRFATAEYGKPYLPASDLRFSLSHSGNLALVAVALEADLGVDVEQIRAHTDVLALARRFLPPEEAAAVETDPPSFFRYWTRREAYLKAVGVGIRGLGLPLPPDYTVTDLEPRPAYAAALAISGTGYEITQFF